MKKKTKKLKAWQFVEKGWCRGEYALNEAGISVSPDSSSAVSFCPAGAILRVYGNWTKEESAARGRFLKAIKSLSMIEWNDSSFRTQSEVVAAMKKANV